MQYGDGGKSSKNTPKTGPANILVLGGHEDAFSDTDFASIVSGFKSCGANVSSIKHNSNEHTPNEQALRNVEKNVSSILKNGNPLTVFVDAHGEVQDGKHVLYLGDANKPVRSRDFFESIARGSDGKPVDVFLTACYGGAALNDVNCLPKGSSIAVLAPSGDGVKINDINRFSPMMSSSSLVHAENFSASKLLNTYLCKSLKNRIAPMFATSGGAVLYLQARFQSQLGRGFSKTEYERSHAQLDTLLGSESVDALISTIASAKHDQDGINATNYGPALAIMKASSQDLEQRDLDAENLAIRSTDSNQPKGASQRMVESGPAVQFPTGSQSATPAAPQTLSNQGGADFSSSSNSEVKTAGLEGSAEQTVMGQRAAENATVQPQAPESSTQKISPPPPYSLDGPTADIVRGNHAPFSNETAPGNRRFATASPRSGDGIGATSCAE
jgi:hypothetical protein